MNKIILTILCLVAAFISVPAQKNAVAAEGREVEFQSYADARYFERNDSNLMGDSSYLAFNSLEKFEQIFGYATIMGDNHFMPENVFDSKLVIAMIKRGESKNINYASGKQIEFNRIQKPGESCCTDAKTVLEIFYQFSNGPVSPEYQRNFTVSLNKVNAKLRFQSYNKKEPTEITVKTGDAKFKEIVKLARKVEFRKDDAEGFGYCTGGSSESLKILDAKRIATFSGHVYHCGGTDYGNMTGDTKLLKTKITALFPNEEYLK